MTNNEKIAVKTKDLARIFKLGDTEVHALRGIDLDIRDGEFAVVLGPSGSGKTTLLNQIGGIDFPTEGTIEVQGATLDEFSLTDLARYRRQKVGWIFQFFNLIPSLSAWENVGLALELADDNENVRERCVKMLENVGLGDKIDRFPSQLSGGEQQRVAIARALVKKPEIVVADEPTGNLDWTTGQTIADLMKKMNQDLGSTFIVVSHDISITEHADRVFHLRDGKIIEVEDKRGNGSKTTGSSEAPTRKKVTND
ncbi:MAG: ABC transporter ATP-binding protein [Candidatus Hodarchaeales archaeon]|jgi:putative ABC transport system ATP-binding protein